MKYKYREFPDGNLLTTKVVPNLFLPTENTQQRNVLTFSNVDQWENPNSSHNEYFVLKRSVS